MSEGFDNELISAMLDGELSTEQRSQVDAHLAESGPARTESAQLQALSKLIADVPADKAPPELAQRVMSNLVNAQSEPASSPTERPSFLKRHWRGIASMATAAAALFVMVRVFSPGNPGLAPEQFAADASVPAPVVDAVSASKMQMQSQLAEVADEAETSLNELPTVGVAMIRVAPDAEELLKRYLRSQMLEHQYAPNNALLTEEGLDAIVVKASRDDIQALLDQVEKESGPGSLELSRDTDPNSLNKRLMASLKLAPPDMKLAGNIERALPAASAFGGGAGAGADAGFGGAESVIAGGGRSMPQARSAPMRRGMKSKPPQPTKVAGKGAAGPGSDIAAQSDISSAEEKLDPAGVAKGAVSQHVAGTDINRAEGAQKTQPSMRVIFVVRKPQTDSSTDPCTDAA